MENMFSQFAEICQNNNLKTSMQKIRQINNVPAEVSQKFYDLYAKGGELDMRQAFEIFWNECNKTTKESKMENQISNYQPRIRKNADGRFYALIVRIDRDGQENVIYGYKGRHFSTAKAAEKSTTNYINSIK